VGHRGLKRIIRLKLGKVQRRLESTHRVKLQIDEPVLDAIAERCTEVESGARNIDNILTNTMLPAVSRLLLSALVEGAKPRVIGVSVAEHGEFAYHLDPGGEAAATA